MQNAPRTIRRGPRLLLALFLGLAAAVGVYLYVTSIQRDARQNYNVAAQTALSADNVELRDVANDNVQPNVATSVADVLGKTLSVPVAASEQILSHRLATATDPTVHKLSDLVPAGKRAMSVTFSEVLSAGGLIAPGDYVDVIAVFNKNTMGKDQSMILMQDVLVLAVAQATSLDQLRQSASGSSQSGANVSLPLPSRGTSTS